MKLILKGMLLSTPKATALVKTLITFHEACGALLMSPCFLPLCSPVLILKVIILKHSYDHTSKSASLLLISPVLQKLPSHHSKNWSAKRGSIPPALSIHHRTLCLSQHTSQNVPCCPMNIELLYISFSPPKNISYDPLTQSLPFKILPRCQGPAKTPPP